MNWRREFQNEFSSRLAWLARNNRKSVFIGVIKLVNAVWFAGLWQAGLAASLSLFLWLGFFVVTIAIAFWLDREDSSSFNKEKIDG